MKLGTIAALALTAAAALIPVSAWAQNDAPPSGLSAQGAVDQSYARNVPADVDFEADVAEPQFGVADGRNPAARAARRQSPERCRQPVSRADEVKK